MQLASHGGDESQSWYNSGFFDFGQTPDSRSRIKADSFRDVEEFQNPNPQLPALNHRDTRLITAEPLRELRLRQPRSFSSIANECPKRFMLRGSNRFGHRQPRSRRAEEQPQGKTKAHFDTAETVVGDSYADSRLSPESIRKSAQKRKRKQASSRGEWR